MRTRSRTVYTYISLLFLVALAASLVGFGRPQAVPVPASSASGGVPDLSGMWQGAWIDTVFFVVGPIEWNITQDATSLSMSGTNDLTGLGQGSAEPISATGTITGGTLTATYQFDPGASVVGGGNFTITGLGVDNLTGTGNTGAPLNFGDYSFTMSAVPNVIVGTFAFTGGGAGNFVMTNTTAVEAESWASIKEKYRAK